MVRRDGWMDGGGGAEQHCSGCRKPLEAVWRMGRERWMGEGRRHARGEKCHAALRRGRTGLSFLLPTGAGCRLTATVLFLGLEAAEGLSSSGAAGGHGGMDPLDPVRS